MTFVSSWAVGSRIQGGGGRGGGLGFGSGRGGIGNVKGGLFKGVVSGGVTVLLLWKWLEVVIAGDKVMQLCTMMMNKSVIVGKSKPLSNGHLDEFYKFWQLSMKRVCWR